MSQSWYILQTKPANEERVRQHCLLADIEVFLPRVKRLFRGRRRPTERLTPLFPSYLFIYADLRDGDMYHNLRFTRGVRKVLGVGRTPLPVDTAIVDVIRERIDKNEILLEQVRYQKGEKNRVLQGPLADLVGVLEKPVAPEGRVRVLLHAYQKSIRAELSCADIELAS